MNSDRPRVLVTGISGNLGLRLLAQLTDFDVIGVDMVPPRTDLPLRFERIDLAAETSCRELADLLRSTGAGAVVHLAFVIDPVRTGVLDLDRMWRINVVGTRRVMEAITEVNRHGGAVRKFVFPSSVSAYGPELPPEVGEDHPLGAHTLPYAIHKKESDLVVQERAAALGPCATYLLRPHIFAGASMENYLVGSLRGTPTGKGRLGRRLRERGRRLPILLPYGKEYPQKRFQFVHVDDTARLLASILRRPEAAPPELIILNVAGRGAPVTLARAAEIARQKVVRLPGRLTCRLILSLLWGLGISGIPPQALPYMVGSYTMSTARLREFLGEDYESVIRYTVEEALADTFRTNPPAAASPEQTAAR